MLAEKDTFLGAGLLQGRSRTCRQITDAFLVRMEDRPLQQKLGYYEERSR
jgi:hypothetical protein